MIRPIIQKQLDKVAFADLSNYNAETNTFIIPKYSKPLYDVQGCYLVKVAKDIVGNTDSALAANWNNSTAPRFEYLKIFVTKKMGGMIYVNSFGYDIDTKQDLMIAWNGWLPTNDLTQLEIL